MGSVLSSVCSPAKKGRDAKDRAVGLAGSSGGASAPRPRLGGPSRRRQSSLRRVTHPADLNPAPFSAPAYTALLPPAQNPSPYVAPPPLSRAAPSRDFSTRG